jgi:hypothetical protein
MNLQPNFEQFKKDEEKLEKIPTIKGEYYFVVNDICKKLLENKEISGKDLADLKIVHEMTQDLERELVNFLDQHRSKKIITELEFLITSNYFLIANQNGPESGDLKNRLVNLDISIENFQLISERISIPEYIRWILIDVYKKIKESLPQK